MTATEELRRMLDERGVEWRESVNVVNCVFTIYESPIFGEVAAMDNDGTLYFHELNGIDVTPSQAIDVTLGRGECELKYHIVEAYGDADEWTCLSCGEQWLQDTDWPTACPWCGKAVK